MVGGVVVEHEEVEGSEELEVVELHLTAEEFGVGEGVLDSGEEAEVFGEGAGESAVAVFDGPSDGVDGFFDDGQ